MNGLTSLPVWDKLIKTQQNRLEGAAFTRSFRQGQNCTTALPTARDSSSCCPVSSVHSPYPQTVGSSRCTAFLSMISAFSPPPAS